MLVRIIIMGLIYSIHSSRKLELIVRENIVFMYLVGFQKPAASTIATFKREHKELIEKIFIETINHNHNKNLINLDSINIDTSTIETYENKYDNLTDEEVAKLLYIVRENIIFDEEENKALENRQKKIMDEEYTKDKIREALKESQNIKLKDYE